VTANAITEAHPFRATSSKGRRYRGQSPDERRVDQRQRMVRASIDEFAARGYHNTSVEDIVRTARSSRTVFYMFFDDRADAMYAAVHSCLRALLNTIQRALRDARPDQDATEVVVRSLVEFLVNDEAAARIMLLEAAGTSAQVNTLRSRMRLELGELLFGLRGNDTDGNRPPTDDAIRAGAVGLLFEPMAHLAETNRLAEAPSHIPALVTAVEKLIR
jgi:AcrR family transcriptional regulator